VTSNLRTPTKVEQVVTAQSTVHLDGSYVVPTTVDIDGLSLTPFKIGLVIETQCKYDLFHFGYVAQRESFRGDVISRHLFVHEDLSLPEHLFFHTRFTIVNRGPVRMLIKVYINKLCGEKPTPLRMGVPPPTTNFVGLTVTLTKTQERKAAIDAPYQST
jgi:hypothetical protein